MIASVYPTLAGTLESSCVLRHYAFERKIGHLGVHIKLASEDTHASTQRQVMVQLQHMGKVTMSMGCAEVGVAEKKECDEEDTVLASTLGTGLAEGALQFFLCNLPFQNCFILPLKGGI